MKLLRVFRKLSQGELAKKAKLSQSTVAQIETSRKTPSLEVLEQIAKALKVPAYKLLRAREVTAMVEGE
jgi:transcriptional regulator with XRE-family HTH domain